MNIELPSSKAYHRLSALLPVFPDAFYKDLLVGTKVGMIDQKTKKDFLKGIDDYDGALHLYFVKTVLKMEVSLTASEPGVLHRLHEFHRRKREGISPFIIEMIPCPEGRKALLKSIEIQDTDYKNTTLAIMDGMAKGSSLIVHAAPPFAAWSTI